MKFNQSHAKQLEDSIKDIEFTIKSMKEKLDNDYALYFAQGYATAIYSKTFYLKLLKDTLSWYERNGYFTEGYIQKKIDEITWKLINEPVRFTASFEMVAAKLDLEAKKKYVVTMKAMLNI